MNLFERLLSEAEEREKETLRLGREVPDLLTLAKRIVRGRGDRGIGVTFRDTKERGGEGKEAVLSVGDREDGLSWC